MSMTDEPTTTAGMLIEIRRLREENERLRKQNEQVFAAAVEHFGNSERLDIEVGDLRAKNSELGLALVEAYGDRDAALQREAKLRDVLQEIDVFERRVQFERCFDCDSGDCTPESGCEVLEKHGGTWINKQARAALDDGDGG